MTGSADGEWYAWKGRLKEKEMGPGIFGEGGGGKEEV